MKATTFILLISALPFFLAGCLSVAPDMTAFELEDFKKVKSHCNVNRDCKVIEVGYVVCGGYDPFVYSSTIREKNEERLLSLAKENYEKTRSESDTQACTLVDKKPPKGICNDNVCGIKYTWKKI